MITFFMEQDEILTNIRGRMALCRRLSDTTTDPWAANALKKVVEEAERDISRIEAGRGQEGEEFQRAQGNN